MCNLSTVVEEKGIEKGKLLQLFELVADGVLSAETAAEKARMSIEEFKRKMEETMQIA